MRSPANSTARSAPPQTAADEIGPSPLRDPLRHELPVELPGLPHPSAEPAEDRPVIPADGAALDAPHHHMVQDAAGVEPGTARIS